MTACAYIDTTGSKPRRCRRKIDLTKRWRYCPECMRLMLEGQDPNAVAARDRVSEHAERAGMLVEALEER